jgi:signal transduction histidine kinase
MNSPDVHVGTHPTRHAASPSKRYRMGSPRLKRQPFALRNWSVSRRLITVIVIALVMGVVFGAFRITSAASSATVFARTTQLAVLGAHDTALADALENERDLTAGLCATSPGGVCPGPGAKLDKTARGLRTQMLSAQATTNPVAAQVQALANQIGSGFTGNVQIRAAQVSSATSLIGALRTEVQAQPPTSVITAYSDAIADLFALNDVITSSSGDSVLADEVNTLNSLSSAKDQTSQERAIMYTALLQGNFNGSQDALTTADGLAQADLNSFQTSGTPAEEDDYLNALGGEKVSTTELLGSLIPALNGSPANPTAPITKSDSLGGAYTQALLNVHQADTSFSTSTSPSLWYGYMSATLQAMRTAEKEIAASVVARSQSLQHGAYESEVLTASVTGAVLLLVLILTIIVARSLVDPLRRLQADALDIASVRLPARVAALSESTDPNVNLDVEPIGVQSTDEIGEVARAFDQVHREAIRLAGNEALLRGNLNSMFISLSRRSVPLIERLSRMIDFLEQNEDDPDRLSNLFSMDHLVTRMRRNSENLLVLAGEEPVRKWSEPVPLNDVARAAMSEIEQYARVVLNVQPDIVVSGQAASDVVHLLAEIIENATMFSPRDTSVHVSGQELSSGGVLLDVRDGGIGVSPTRMEEMNWRLENVPVLDVSVSRHMGLFAVSRLASRHGIRVRLRPASPQGLSTLIWLPGNVTGRATSKYGDLRSRQPVGESTVAHLRVGGRHASARQSLGPAEDDYAGNGGYAGNDSYAGNGGYAGNSSPRRESASTGAAANWFRAKRPSGVNGEGASAHAAGMQAAGLQAAGLQGMQATGLQAAGTQSTGTQSTDMQPLEMRTASPRSFSGGPTTDFQAPDSQAPGRPDSSTWSAFGGTASTAPPAPPAPPVSTPSSPSTASTASGWGGGDWQPAEPPREPVQGDLTASGLPTRVPRSNPSPGTGAERTAPFGSPTGAFSAPAPTSRYDTDLAPSRQTASLPRRSPEHARSRMRGFQLGSHDTDGQTPRAGEESSR